MMNTRYAPCVNFVMVTTTSTKTVSVAPTELMTSPILAPRRSRRMPCGEMGVNPGAARDYSIMSIPPMAVFQGGKVVKQIVGAKPKAAILRDLADYL